MKYYVNNNAQANDDHEVHRSDCQWLPDAENRTYLGEFNNAVDAVKKAREFYNKVDGCYYCCKEAHRS